MEITNLKGGIGWWSKYKWLKGWIITWWFSRRYLFQWKFWILLDTCHCHWSKTGQDSSKLAWTSCQYFAYDGCSNVIPKITLPMKIQKMYSKTWRTSNWPRLHPENVVSKVYDLCTSNSRQTTTRAVDSRPRSIVYLQDLLSKPGSILCIVWASCYGEERKKKICNRGGRKG